MHFKSYTLKLLYIVWDTQTMGFCENLEHLVFQALYNL